MGWCVDEHDLVAVGLRRLQDIAQLGGKGLGDRRCYPTTRLASNLRRARLGVRVHDGGFRAAPLRGNGQVNAKRRLGGTLRYPLIFFAKISMR